MQLGPPYFGLLNKMIDDASPKQFYTVRDLARLGLWEHAGFYGANFEDNLEIYKHDNALRYTCTIESKPWVNLLWVFT